MKYLNQDQQSIQKYTTTTRGVFSLADLKNLFNEPDDLRLNRRISHLIAHEILLRFSRGFYTTPSPDLNTLSMRMHEESYISTGSALAKHLMIGPIPSKTVFAVKAGKTRTYEGPVGKIVYYGIQPELFFGCEYIDGIRYASPEKALLDTLYFYLKGRSWFFNIFSDIAVEKLNESIISEWLSHYRNSRFTTFVEGFLNARLRSCPYCRNCATRPCGSFVCRGDSRA